jgi:C4-dicarboxylate transporter, DctM subunit
MIWGALILLGCIALGIPIYVGLLAAGLFMQVVLQGIPIDMVIIGLYDGVAKFTLIAVPCFLFSGVLMEKSSVGLRLVDSIIPWLVRLRGGVPIGGIIANEIFGAISGSSAAAAGTIGRVMIPIVTKTNNERFSLGLFTSAGALAIVMPPSITMILFAAAVNISIGALFVAGIIPAIIIGLCLSAYIFKKSPSPDPSQHFDLRFALKKLREGTAVLMLPVIVLGGIYTGIFTPTEAAAVAVIASFFIPVIYYREMGMETFFSCVKETTKVVAQIFILIACSVVFSQALAVLQVPEALKHWLSGTSPWVFLLLLNLVLLLVGCFFDPTSAVLVLAPVVAPVAESLGIDLLHLGIVFTVNLAIGMATPPFGLNLFVIQSIFKKKLEVLGRAVIPFVLVFIFALAIITYLPELYLWLPRLWQASLK